eukprot:3904025-Prorocentrum_lima.AAC.1
MEDAAAPPTVADTPPPLHEGTELPADFLTRVRRLSPQTLVHIPLGARAKLARVTARVLQDLCRSEGQACWLEEARSNFLLSRVPTGRSKTHDIQQRLEMWETG